MRSGRRSWLKLVASGGFGVAVGSSAEARDVEASTKASGLKDAKEVPTVCNFCSCGCGIVCHVKDGKLVNLEGDPEHVLNRGALCSKGAAMFATPTSPERVTAPLYRAPGSDRWQELGWDEALDKLARKLQATRDATWIASDRDGDAELPANRTEGIALLGGAQSTNEECYLWAKLGRLLGTPYVEHQARL